MSGRVALVTGGGAGMGEAICRRLATDGMRVGVLDVDSASADAVASSIAANGGDALALGADISDRQQVMAAVNALRARFGPITVLINNAGVESFTPFADIDDDAWDRIMRINLKGAYVVTQSVLDDMKSAGWGRIVNLASMAAQAGAAGMVDYAATKGGIVGMTRSLAIELGPLGITVNAIAPGFIMTPMAQRSLDRGYFKVSVDDLVKHYPIARAGKPEEVAAACAYFVAEDAAYTSGQVLGINGATYM